MQLTNKFNLPPAIAEAVRNDPYSRGDSDISVTQLIGPPQIRKLYEQHENKLVQDVSERIWALLGQAVHTILERAEPSGIAESRLFAEIDGYKLSGQLDSHQFVQQSLYDYKVTSAWTILRGPRDEWVKQQNIYRWLAFKNGMTINNLFIGAILRDWSRKKARDDSNYPQTPSLILTLPVWTIEETEIYIRERLTIHFSDEIPDCTDEDRWATEPVWAVMKEGRKTAIRVTGLSTQRSALEWAAANGHADQSNEGDIVLRSKIFIQERPRTFIRCADQYCPVTEHCPQWKREQELSVQPRAESEET